MKISKLFHWLYALLMLLPAFFVGGRMLYTIFNKNAKDSYSGNELITTFTDINGSLDINKVYHFDSDSASVSDSIGYIYPYTNSAIYENSVLLIGENELVRFMLTLDNGVTHVVLQKNNGNYYFRNVNNYHISFDFEVGAHTFVNSVYDNYIHEVSTNVENTLDNAFDYSMNQINELPLFSWAKDSFLVEPFAYIGDLFGIPEGSPIITLLSYWLDISLVWLVFDLLMYVPLLAHRWLDKGVLE